MSPVRTKMFKRQMYCRAAFGLLRTELLLVPKPSHWLWRGHRDGHYDRGVTVKYEWRGDFGNAALNALHADGFRHTYNHHRCHTALGGKPPITRVNNPAGQYI
ncbi:hypothetical protein [Streptomyces sp. NPDC050988]|uniref:hypothetical protein n=1 Tax=Streptomyces sp. NPDC050988 TaxID=3365637 RepID=UPI00378BC748